MSHSKRIMRTTTSWRGFAFLVFCLLAVCGPVLADHPNQPQGFDPERSYQGGSDQIDQVDLFSGRLTMTIPIGPFSLIYNSNVWRYQRNPQGEVEAFPDQLTTGGLGWHLGWGEVYHPDHWYNGTGKWLFVADDGGRHTFHPNLHDGENDGNGRVFYSRDGSYLRLTISANNCDADIEMPDGMTRRYTGAGGACGSFTEKTLRKVWSRFGSVTNADLTVAYNSDDTLRTVTASSWTPELYSSGEDR